MGVVKGVVVGMAKERGHGCGQKGVVMGVAKGVVAIPVPVPLLVAVAVAVAVAVLVVVAVVVAVAVAGGCGQGRGRGYGQRAWSWVWSKGRGHGCGQGSGSDSGMGSTRGTVSDCVRPSTSETHSTGSQTQRFIEGFIPSTVSLVPRLADREIGAVNHFLLYFLQILKLRKQENRLLLNCRYILPQ